MVGLHLWGGRETAGISDFDRNQTGTGPMLVKPYLVHAASLSCLGWLLAQRPAFIRLSALPPRCSRARARATYPGCPESLDIPTPISANPKWHARHKAKAAKAKERAAVAEAEVERADDFDEERFLRYRRWRAEQAQEELAIFRTKTVDAPTMCIDCEWEGAMADRELNALARTLMRCYGSNRKAERPFQLVLSGVAPGSRMERALRRQANYEPWADWIFISAEPYIEVFQAQRLVYLSPDGKDTADSFEDKDAVFVLGALSDSKRRLRGLTRDKADAQGIASVRLPIKENLGLDGGSAVLVVNHVLDIALARRAARDEFRDWLAHEELFLGDRRLREEELFYRQEFLQEFSLGSRSNFEDLLFHPVEHLSELPELEAQLGGAGLRFSGVRVPAEAQGVARRWSRFFTADRRLEVPGWPQMPLLAFLHRLETELEPLLFTNMYVFTAVAGRATSVLADMSRWVEVRSAEEAESLPLPFEPNWPPDLLATAAEAFCARVRHHANTTNGPWTFSLEPWLEAKVALGVHSAQVARALGASGSGAEAYCAQVAAQFGPGEKRRRCGGRLAVEEAAKEFAPDDPRLVINYRKVYDVACISLGPCGHEDPNVSA
ncbi:unnamed protein product [Effrenium voratum]|nr:unnamed protein product [Effrenium voratum]